MENAERKEIIRKLLNEGRTLSEIQNYLIKERNDSITYLELRLLLAEMDDVKLPSSPSSKFGEPTPTPPPTRRSPAPSASAMSPAKPAATALPTQKLSIAVDSVVRAGAMLSGSVSLPSGAKCDWFIDGYGRVGIEPKEGSARPTQQDLQEFQSELHRVLAESQGAF